MLSRVPAGELMDSPRRAPVRRTAEVLYSDTSWRPCQIVAWAQYQGGWAALIRWPDGREDWRQFNRRHMRPQAHGDPGLAGGRVRGPAGSLLPGPGRALAIAVFGEQRGAGQREHGPGHQRRAQRGEQQR